MTEFEIGWHAAIAAARRELDAMRVDGVGDGLDAGSLIDRAHNRTLLVAREHIGRLRPEERADV